MGNIMNKVVSKWLMQRIAAVFLAPLLIWFLFKFDNLMTYSYSEAVMFLNNKINILTLSFIFILAFFHMKIGFSEIFEDYIHDEKIKKFANLLVLLISLTIPIAAVVVMIILGL
jgi:succinate dehydrogenase hydrophobic membrane anchor protein